jgi:hypothetical protein
MQSGKSEKPKFLALPNGARKKATFPGADVPTPARSDRKGFYSARTYVSQAAPINPEMQPASDCFATLAAGYAERISFNGMRAQISGVSPRSTSISAAVASGNSRSVAASVNCIQPVLVAADSPENGEQPTAAGQTNLQLNQKTISAPASIAVAQPALSIKPVLVKEDSNSPQRPLGSFDEKNIQNQTAVEYMLSRLKCCWFTEQSNQVYDLRVTAPDKTQKPISTIK